MPDDQTNTEKKYNQDFMGCKRKAALDFAADARKFEIELYWKRAAYFWAFSAAAFGAYLAVLGSDSLQDKPQALLLVCCLGLVFSSAWYCVNRASKYWQLNWELHVDRLEDDHMGPLYKTLLTEDSSFWRIERAYPFSVSKINQLLSLFVTLIFALMLGDTLIRHYRLAFPPDLFPTGCVLLTGLSLIVFWVLGRVEISKPVQANRVPRTTRLIP